MECVFLVFFLSQIAIGKIPSLELLLGDFLLKFPKFFFSEGIIEIRQGEIYNVSFFERNPPHLF